MEPPQAKHRLEPPEAAEKWPWLGTSASEGPVGLPLGAGRGTSATARAALQPRSARLLPAEDSRDPDSTSLGPGQTHSFCPRGDRDNWGINKNACISHHFLSGWKDPAVM